MFCHTVVIRVGNQNRYILELQRRFKKYGHLALTVHTVSFRAKYVNNYLLNYIQRFDLLLETYRTWIAEFRHIAPLQRNMIGRMITHDSLGIGRKQ